LLIVDESAIKNVEIDKLVLLLSLEARKEII
jgi:hypothetical protein